MYKSNSIIIGSVETLHTEKSPRNWWQELLKVQKQQKQEKEMIIDITIKLPSVKVEKPKRRVRVFSNFVKVGFNQYSIRIDPFTGYEYVKIDGKRYEIVRDYFNRGVLVEI